MNQWNLGFASHCQLSGIEVPVNPVVVARALVPRSLEPLYFSATAGLR